MSLEPPIDPASDEAMAYRRALGAFATGVCVVTADGPQGPLGLTINSFTSVSLEPRLVLWCLDERSERWPIFAEAERFAIHVLKAGDQARAARFARGAAGLQPNEYERRGAGAPGLADVLARFECRARQHIQLGDHMVIVGEVEAYEAVAGAPLTFWRGGYGAMEMQP